MPRPSAPPSGAATAHDPANVCRSAFAGSSAEMLMEEQELLSMISFTLKESADRLAALAAEVRTESVRAQLAELSRQLLHYAKIVDRS